MSDMYVYMYVCMYACMYQELLKTTTNSSCVCAHLANKADSDSEADSDRMRYNENKEQKEWGLERMWKNDIIIGASETAWRQRCEMQ